MADEASTGPALNAPSGGGSERFIYPLGIFVPVAVALDLANASGSLIFFASALGIVPAAALMGRATEELAARSGPIIGGLLNVTFGNAPELIIAVFALVEGLQEVVKASLIGSIVGNILLVMGAAMFAGGIGREKQTFSRRAAGAQTGMLLLVLGALILPALFQLVHGGGLPAIDSEKIHFGGDVEKLSFAVAIVLIFSYCAGLVFSLKTHAHLLNPYEGEIVDDTWSVRKSVIVLAIAGLVVGGMSEILVGSLTDAAKSVGLSQFFIGVVVVAIVGNAAEHWVAVLVATKNKMDLAVNIAIGSSTQIGLFVAPVLVLLSFAVGAFPMPLVFNGLELGAVALAILVAHFATSEGESNWFEGLQLLALYTVLGVTFFFA